MGDAGRDLIGRTLGGRFRLKSFIGEGAMAAVYRGEQDDEPREVAVKVMHPELASDETFVKRFMREAKATGRVEHPNTVRIVGLGSEGSTLYLAMELLDGQDLFEVLVKERRLPEARAARIGAQVCGALEAAHAHGIVHRDLKPENVMLLRDPAGGPDHVKVLDFGIAKLMDRDTASSDASPISSVPSSVLTRVGSVIGTPEYMSPEQCRGEAIDARSDVYATGILLYQLLTGKPPFVGSGASPIEVLFQHTDAVPVPPSTLVPGLDPRLEKTILTALAKWPAQRQQSAREMQAELEALLGDLGAKPDARRTAPTPALGLQRISEPGLPGVPGGVVISSDRAVVRRETPVSDRQPITQRSPEEQAEVESKAAKKPEFEKTLESPGAAKQIAAAKKAVQAAEEARKAAEKAEPTEAKKAEPVEAKKAEPVEAKKAEPVEAKKAEGKAEPVEAKKPVEAEPVEAEEPAAKAEPVAAKAEPVAAKKPAKPVRDEEVAAKSPRPAPLATPKPAAAPVASHGPEVSGRMAAILITAICVAIWLVRFLRFGME